MRKREIHLQLEALASLKNSFSSKQSYGKARAKAIKGSPASIGKERMVLTILVSTLYPKSESHTLNSASKQASFIECRTPFNIGRSQIASHIFFGATLYFHL